MGYENNDRRADNVYSQRVKAGKRRTYFFDVRATRGNDFFLTITESCKRFDGDGYERHKIFLYKEDFNKFIKGLSEAVDHVKTELMPDFDFDAFSHEYTEGVEGAVIETNVTAAEPAIEEEVVSEVIEEPKVITEAAPETNFLSNEEVEKW